MADSTETEGARAALEAFLDKIPSHLRASREAALTALGLAENRVGSWNPGDLVNVDTDRLADTIEALGDAQTKLARFATALRMGRALGREVTEALDIVSGNEAIGFAAALEAERVDI
jgi:hypothetical protein